MKQLMTRIGMIVLSAMYVSSIWAIDAELKAKIENLYQQNKIAIESKDLETLMSQFSEDYVNIDTGITKKELREAVESKLFKSFSELRVTTTINQMDQIGSEIRIICDCAMQAKTEPDAEWKTLSEDTLIEFVKEENGALKFVSNARTTKERLQNIHGNVYRDEEIGYSLTAPEGWTLIPASHPRLQGFLLASPPNSNCSAIFGYLEMPYNVGAKEAIEGDDAAIKRISNGKYQSISTGPTKVGEFDAYESMCTFEIKGKACKRRNVYFTTGGLLYTLIFTATPADQWDKVEAGFNQFMNSITLSDEAKEHGMTRERAKSAQGEIVGRIYSNDELGCQVAAPSGWSIESTNIGKMFSVNMKPASGKSLARFISVDTKGAVTLEKVFKSELEGIEKITTGFSKGDVNEITVSGHQGLTCDFQFTLEGLGTLKRRSVMFLENNILYMFVCDAIPPSEFDSLASSFDEIIQSFTLN